MTASAPSPIGVEIAAIVSSIATGEEKLNRRFHRLHRLFLCYDVPRWISKRTTSSVRHWRFIKLWDLGSWRPYTKKLYLSSWPNTAFHFAARLKYRSSLRARGSKTCYRTDFICHGSIIVELKAISKLGDIETAQVLNYLRATGFHKGLLFNFGATSLEKRRLVMSPEHFTERNNNPNL